MLREYFDAGGPVMYAVLAVWIFVLAALLDRCIYAIGRVFRRPLKRVRLLATKGDKEGARRLLEREREAADRRLGRIEAISQIAPSVGLFGTVLGIARSFFARGGEVDLAAPEALAEGLSTALFTTVGGLIVFLTGQIFLIAYGEWQDYLERDLSQLALEPVADSAQPALLHAQETGSSV